MKIKCAWCKKDMGEKPGPAGETTFGICPECRAALMAAKPGMLEGLATHVNYGGG